MSDIAAVTQSRNILGESPVWCALAQRLYWIDARAPAVYRLDPRTGVEERWDMPEKLGSLVVKNPDTLLIAMQRRVALWKIGTAEFRTVFLLPANEDRFRFNDGKCDPQGRFIAGTLKDTSRVLDGRVEGGLPSEPVGALYQIVEGEPVRRLFGDLTIPNSLAWSPDGKTMYFSDTARDVIHAFDYEPETGALGARRLFVDTTSHPGKPDGSAVDQDGYLWNAEYGGWRIVRYTPNGQINRVIDLPVQQPTSCAFGGDDHGTLFVTTATQRIPEAELVTQPLAGAVLALDAGVKGLPGRRFGNDI